MEKNIKMVTKMYCKVGSKWKETECLVSNITKREYLSLINTTKFFKKLGYYERLINDNTCVGYVPVYSNSITPDKKERVIRDFCFDECVEKIYYDDKKKEYK